MKKSKDTNKTYIKSIENSYLPSLFDLPDEEIKKLYANLTKKIKKSNL